MSVHLGGTPIYEKIAARFFWYGIYNDFADYIQNWDRCQRQSRLSSNVKSEMHSVPISLHVMKQVGLDLCSHHELDGYRHLVVCIDYFTKWSEVKPIRDKTALMVATFLYELMCRHGCFEVQITEQGRKFVNSAYTCLHDLTGVEQRITSAYHPQSNGLLERQNRIIKNVLVKVMEAHLEEWPHIIEDALFAHRVSRHSSTQYLLSFLIYNKDAVLPIDVKFSLAEREVNETEVFDEGKFEAILASAVRIRGEFHESATGNIRKAQDKQNKTFIDAIFPTAKLKWEIISYYVTKKKDRKGGKFPFARLDPYIVSEITPKRVTTLKKPDGEILKVKCNLSQLKLYVEEKTVDTGGDTTEFTVVLDNKKTSTSVNTGTNTPLDCNEIYY